MVFWLLNFAKQGNLGKNRVYYDLIILFNGDYCQHERLTSGAQCTLITQFVPQNQALENVALQQRFAKLEHDYLQLQIQNEELRGKY